MMTEILQAVTGSGYSSSSDGLEAALARQRQAAMGRRGMGPSRDILDRRSSALVDAMGFDPYSAGGQSAAKMISSAYSFFPGVVGSLIGLPDSGSYYRQIANGSRGIGMASMGASASIFNPYSTQQATQSAMSLADLVHGMAVNKSGYNVNFTNGLNMGEVGMVAQRMLSADFMYKGQNGDRLDTASEEFKDKLEKLGAKFNAAASSLAKVTGSVSEALRLMDRMAGGNFLGGSERQASEIADRARSMAAAIRVTSAMSGMSPQEMYGHMTNTQQAITARYGVNAAIASASGFSDMMMNPAFMSTMSYGVWAANNPNATQTQKNQALLATQYRASSWANSSAENMTAIVSYFRKQGLISDDMVGSIESALRNGRVNDVVDMVKSAVGEDVYHEMMSDPGALMAARLSGDEDTYKRLGQAGNEGSLRQAAIGGTRRLTDWAMSRTDDQLDRLGGRSGNRRTARNNAAAGALRNLARRKYKLAGGGDWDADRLRNYLVKSGADADEVDTVQYQAEIDAQMAAVRESTLSGGSLDAAKRALVREIDNSALNSQEKARLKGKVAKGESLGSILENDLIGRQGLSARDARNMRKRVTGGKMFSDTADKMLSDLKNARDKWNGPGAKEDEWARKSLANIKVMANEGAIQKVAAGSEFDNAKTDRERMNLVRKEAQRLKDEGLIGKDANLDVAENEAYRMLVDEALGGHIGDLDKEDAESKEKYGDIVDRVAKAIDDTVNNGGSVQEGFAAGMKAVRDMVTGDGGQEQVDKFIKEGSDKISSKNLASKMASAVGSRTRAGVEQGNIKLDRRQVSDLAKLKWQVDNAAFSAGGPEQAVLTQLLASFEKGGGTAAITTLRENGKDLKWLNDLGMADVVETLQRSDAENRQNNIGNALALGRGKHAKAAIEAGKGRLDELSKAISSSGLDEKALRQIVNGEGGEADQKALDAALEKAGWKTEEQKAYGRAYIKSLGEKMEGGLGALFDEDKRKAAKDSKNDDKWAEVTKDAAAAASPQLVEITEILRGILEFLGMLMNSPMQVAMSGIGGMTR